VSSAWARHGEYQETVPTVSSLVRGEAWAWNSASSNGPGGARPRGTPLVASSANAARRVSRQGSNAVRIRSVENLQPRRYPLA